MRYQAIIILPEMFDKLTYLIPIEVCFMLTHCLEQNLIIMGEEEKLSWFTSTDIGYFCDSLGIVDEWQRLLQIHSRLLDEVFKDSRAVAGYLEIQWLDSSNIIIYPHTVSTTECLLHKVISSVFINLKYISTCIVYISYRFNYITFKVDMAY